MRSALTIGLILISVAAVRPSFAEEGQSQFSRRPFLNFLFGGLLRRKNRNQGDIPPINDPQIQSDDNLDPQADDIAPPTHATNNGSRNDPGTRRPIDNSPRVRNSTTPNRVSNRRTPSNIPDPAVSSDDVAGAKKGTPPSKTRLVTQEEIQKYLKVPEGLELTPLEKMIVVYTNLYRAWAGKPALPVSKAATLACRNLSDQMAANGNIFHDKNPRYEVANRENVGLVPAGLLSSNKLVMLTAAFQVYNLINSPGHRENIMTADQSIGVGVSIGKSSYGYQGAFTCQKFKGSR